MEVFSVILWGWNALDISLTRCFYLKNLIKFSLNVMPLTLKFMDGDSVSNY